MRKTQLLAHLLQQLYFQNMCKTSSSADAECQHAEGSPTFDPRCFRWTWLRVSQSFLSTGNGTEVQEVLSTILKQHTGRTSPQRGRCVKAISRSDRGERRWMRCSSDAHHRWHGNTGAEGVTLPAAQLYEARLGTPTCGCVWKEQSASAPRRWRREGCWLGIGRASAPSCGRRAPAGLHGYGRTCSPASALLVYIPDFSSVTAQIKPQGSSSICMSIESCPITKKTPQNIRFCLHGKEKNPTRKTHSYSCATCYVFTHKSWKKLLETTTFYIW